MGFDSIQVLDLTNSLLMRKPFFVIGLLIVPVVFILAGLYLESSLITSIGCIVLIFYIIMAVRGKFSDQKKES